MILGRFDSGLRRIRTAKIVLPLVALIGLLVGFASAQAAIWQTYVWPPSGFSYQFAYPSGTWHCSPSTTYQYSAATEVFDNVSGAIYLYYYDVYNGTTTYPGGSYWIDMRFIDTKNGVTQVVNPPWSGVPTSTDWTVWRNQYYGYTAGSREFMVETRASAGLGGCEETARVVFRH
jgi:hypothetical protein